MQRWQWKVHNGKFREINIFDCDFSTKKILSTFRNCSNQTFLNLEKLPFLQYYLQNKGFKSTIENRALPNYHEQSLETKPFKGCLFLNQIYL